MNGAVFQNLIIFVPFAGEQYDVARTSGRDRAMDRLAAVEFNFVFDVGAAQADQRVVDDIDRILTTRIVAGEYDVVAQFSGGLPHERALAAIAIAAAAEERDDAAAGERARNL